MERARFFPLLPALILLLGVLGPFAAAPVQAQTTLVSNLATTAADGSVSLAGFAHGQGFTTGSAAGGYTLSSIEVGLGLGGGVTSAIVRETIHAELWSAATGGGPNMKVADLAVPSGTLVGTVSFAAPANTALLADTTYHFVLYTTGSDAISVRYTASSTEDTAQTGWSIGDQRWYIGSNQPVGTWEEVTSSSVKIRVKGTQTTPTPTPTMAPAAPTGLRVTPGASKLELSWTAPSGEVTGYDVHYTSSTTVANNAAASGNDAGAAWVAVRRTGAAGSQEISGLTNNLPHRVRVRGVNSAGIGAWEFGSGTPKLTSSGSMDATLSALVLTDASGVSAPFTPAFSPTTYAYAYTATASFSRWKVTPTVNQVDATVRAGLGTNLMTVASGSASDFIDLNFNANRITVEVTAQAGNKRSYTITVAHERPVVEPPTVTPPVVPNRIPSFGDATVTDQSYTVGTAVTALTLPAATGGDGTLVYSLTPALPSGLVLDTATRTLMGTPEATQASRRYTWTVMDADGDTAVLSFAIEVVDPRRRARIQEAVKRTLAEVARRAMASALDNIGVRFGDIGTSGLSLAGQWVPLQDLRANAALTGDGLLHNCTAQLGFEPSDCMQPAQASGHSMTAGQLFGTSSFSVHLNAAPGDGVSTSGPLWSVWGRGDIGSFAGRGDTRQRYDGDLRTGWLGIDARSGAWVAGLAVSHADGEADYAFAGDGISGEGELDTKMTAIYPYGRWELDNGLELHGVAGVGTGDARHKPQDGETESGDLRMHMASLGLRHTLPEWAGLQLAMRADASVTRIETDDGPDDIHGLSADSWRLRAGLEASRAFALGHDAEFRPFMEAAVRQDGGDGLEGSGVELAGGLRYAAPNVLIEARGRWLATHSDKGAQEKGVSVTARAGPGANGRGLFLALSPRWGAPTGGAQALWGETLANPSESTNEGTVDAQLGYAFAAPVPGVITPFIETGLAGDDHRRLRLGTRFEAAHANVRLELVGERSEREAVRPEHLLRLDLQLGLF